MQASSDKSVQVNLRLPASLKEAAEKAAAADYRSLTSLIEKLLAGYVRAKPRLEDWHERAWDRLVSILVDEPTTTAMPAIVGRSYAIETMGLPQLEPALLSRIARELHHELGNFLLNPEILYPYTRPELAPYFTYDSQFTQPGFDEILECVALPQNNVSSTELWRLSPMAIASDVRILPEDHERVRQVGLEPGKWFSPLFMTRQLYALIQHAYLFSLRLSSVVSVQFQCEWSGLAERELRDPDYMPGEWRGRIARINRRTTRGEWPIDRVRMHWPEIASQLGGPVIRLFDPTFDYSADWIRREMRRILGRDEPLDWHRQS